MDKAGYLMSMRRLQQHARADDIGLEEYRGPGNGAVDVRFGGEMNDDVVTGNHLVDQAGVADIALDKGVALQLVELRHRRRRPRLPMGARGSREVHPRPRRA